MGTISSVDLRRHHPDLMAQTGQRRDKAAIDRVNLIALDREIKAAQAIAAGRGVVAVNVMRAVSEYAGVRAPVLRERRRCHRHGRRPAAGPARPDGGFPDVALIPILSDVRGIGVVLKKWVRKNACPTRS